MIVNDFKCAADGRFLERVSLKAGSAVLTDSDGILRPDDVGKQIAIPGAQDLGTSIARLIEHREVKNAQMSAGSDTLIDPAVKPVPTEEPFLKTAHVVCLRASRV